ncbi:MAG: hypothetical protein O3C21_09755, partial [Verrucomicrobia bacterium]|nr:hypothetical protein [Verrucomicrobiota bacterium]
ISHQNDNLVVCLAEYFGNTRETTKALLGAFDRASDEHGQAQVIEAMFAIQMPESTDKLIEAIKEHAGKTKAKRGYSYYLLRLVGSVPETEKKKIEELIPTLPEDIADVATRYIV